MTYREAIEKVVRDEIAQGQSAWEMVQDGYGGDVDAYIEDYIHDYDCEECDGVITVYRTYGGDITGDTERWDVLADGYSIGGSQC